MGILQAHIQQVKSIGCARTEQSGVTHIILLQRRPQAIAVGHHLEAKQGSAQFQAANAIALSISCVPQ